MVKIIMFKVDRPENADFNASVDMITVISLEYIVYFVISKHSNVNF